MKVPAVDCSYSTIKKTNSQHLIIMHFSFTPVPLSHIDLNDEWNLHPWTLRDIPHSLQDSLKNIGILHPPILLQTASNKFSVIHGFKRLLYCKKYTCINEPVCLTLASNTSTSDLLDLLLEDQLTLSTLSLAEKSKFLQIAARFIDIDTIIEKYLPKLDVKKRPSSLHNILKIVDQDKEIIEAIHSGRIKNKIAFEILKLPEPEDRTALIHLFEQLCMGDGKQRRFFVLIRDLAFRQQATFTQYLNGEEIQEILNHGEMNIPQKIQHLGNLLQDRLTPSACRAEEHFSEQVKKIQLPDHCVVSHAQAFEKDQVTLSITFANMAICEEKWNHLKQFVVAE